MVAGSMVQMPRGKVSLAFDIRLENLCFGGLRETLEKFDKLWNSLYIPLETPQFWYMLN